MGIFEPIKPGSQSSIFAAAGLFLTSTWITVSLRIWVRGALAKTFGWDDALLVLSALTFTGFCAVILSIETIGGAEHIDQMGIPALTHTISMVVATFGLYILTMVLFKISLGLFYLRFIIRTWQRYVVYLAVVINTLYGLLLFFVATFQCGDPTEYLQNELRGVCMPNGPLYGIQLTGAIINAATDWTLAILPIFVLIKANMPIPAKISAGFILLLGCSGSIISLIRIQYIKDLRPGPNFFRSITDVAIWSIAECGICISAAAAAALKSLFRGLLERTGHSLMQTLSLGSHMKSAPGTSSNGRHSKQLFGDWGMHTPQHQMVDIEDQKEATTSIMSVPQNHEQRRSSLLASQGDLNASMDPTLQNTRVLSKRGLSKPDVNRTDRRLEPSSKHQSSTRRDKSMSDGHLVPKNGSGLRHDRPNISRGRSVRERGISRPVLHDVNEIILPTPKFGTRPQPVLLIDTQRSGSPDWGHSGAQDWPSRAYSSSPRSPLDRR